MLEGTTILELGKFTVALQAPTAYDLSGTHGKLASERTLRWSWHGCVRKAAQALVRLASAGESGHFAKHPLKVSP